MILDDTTCGRKVDSKTLLSICHRKHPTANWLGTGKCVFATIGLSNHRSYRYAMEDMGLLITPILPIDLPRMNQAEKAGVSLWPCPIVK